VSKNRRSFDDVISDFGLHGGLQFGFKDGGRVIVPVLLEITGLSTRLTSRNEQE
jgi:hypothetical protein